MNKILVVAAHPDDEILGVGGTILKHINSGDRVEVLILGDGETSRGAKGGVEKKENQAQKAAQAMKIQGLTLEKLPDNQFDSLPLLEIVKKVVQVVASVKPDIVYTHHRYDLNVDHCLTCRAVLTACRPQPGFFVKKILTFETPSSTEWQIKDGNHIFCPNEYTNIGDFIDKKLGVLNIYNDELRKFPHPRSIEGVRVLAQYRGMEVGYKYAEAFQIIRNLND